MFRTSTLAIVALSLALASPALAQNDARWVPFTDEVYGFSAELPLAAFEEVDASESPGLALREIGGSATINLYGGPADGLTRDGLEERLENGPQISTITYRAGGDSWFVLSGYYNGDATGTIFYTKVLFSPDQQTFSAFEITFPSQDKPRLESLVERFEDSFTRPRP